VVPTADAFVAPPAILVGGQANALAVARSLGRRRIPVYLLNRPDECVRYSRFATFLRLPEEGSPETAWARYLTGPESEPLRGAVLLACSDDGIELIATYRNILKPKFRLDQSNVAAQWCMLNKLTTYEAATAAGVPTPRFRPAPTRQLALRAVEELSFPLLVKPHFSHLYQRRFGRKCVLASSVTEMLAAYDAAKAGGVNVLLVEFVPGTPDRTWSYYTYLDESGKPLYEFVKRVLRRFPADTGYACFEISDHQPQVRELSLRLLRHVRLRGVANVEFKRDERDDCFKLIECNARFSGATCLLAACGIDNALLVYNRIVGRPHQLPVRSARRVCLWYPYEDFLAFRRLWQAGRLTWFGWLQSLARRRILPSFQWSDPVPSLVKELRRLKSALARRVNRLASALVTRCKNRGT
jgi:predicted ATP-grasp superfamily ATP-dependent carboligase